MFGVSGVVGFSSCLTEQYVPYTKRGGHAGDTPNLFTQNLEHEL